MKIRFHKGMSFEDWKQFSFAHQVLNIASEMNRAKNWMKQGDAAAVKDSLDRAYELIDLTIEAQGETSLLRELLVFREWLGHFYPMESFSEQAIGEFVTSMKCLVDFDPESHLIKASLAA
ncbi:MAG: hypothetical protein EXS63_03620 [Candidatus Omnitrophica bacterium]|nr:hypothetical protein [Candidatus Omnitrophota bacterium]